MSKYQYYDNVNVNNFTHIPVVSSYNHNYYEGIDGDLLYGESDDDMTTEWFVIKGGSQPEYIGYSILDPGKPERISYDTRRT
jgi:hypothetical protein